MSSIHEILTGNEGAPIISIGPVEVVRQNAPKTSKNGKLYSTAFLKNGGTDVMLQLWDGAAGWKLPLDTPITLRGKFSKSTFGTPPRASVRCDELSKPEGAEEFKAEEIQAPLEKPSVRAAIDAGLRAADYVARKEKPELSGAAFSFAAQAFLDGHKLE
jgi:hypothetical protein